MLVSEKIKEYNENWIYRAPAVATPATAERNIEHSDRILLSRSLNY